MAELSQKTTLKICYLIVELGENGVLKNGTYKEMIINQ
jgi:hypothetical protein